MGLFVVVIDALSLGLDVVVINALSLGLDVVVIDALSLGLDVVVIDAVRRLGGGCLGLGVGSGLGHPPEHTRCKLHHLRVGEIACNEVRGSRVQGLVGSLGHWVVGLPLRVKGCSRGAQGCSRGSSTGRH